MFNGCPPPYSHRHAQLTEIGVSPDRKSVVVLRHYDLSLTSHLDTFASYAQCSTSLGAWVFGAKHVYHVLLRNGLSHSQYHLRRLPIPADPLPAEPFLQEPKAGRLQVDGEFCASVNGHLVREGVPDLTVSFQSQILRWGVAWPARPDERKDNLLPELTLWDEGLHKLLLCSPRLIGEKEDHIFLVGSRDERLCGDRDVVFVQTICLTDMVNGAGAANAPIYLNALNYAQGDDEESGRKRSLPEPPRMYVHGVEFTDSSCFILADRFDSRSKVDPMENVLFIASLSIAPVVRVLHRVALPHPLSAGFYLPVPAKLTVYKRYAFVMGTGPLNMATWDLWTAFHSNNGSAAAYEQCPILPSEQPGIGYGCDWGPPLISGAFPNDVFIVCYNTRLQFSTLYATPKVGKIEVFKMNM